VRCSSQYEAGHVSIDILYERFGGGWDVCFSPARLNASPLMSPSFHAFFAFFWYFFCRNVQLSLVCLLFGDAFTVFDPQLLRAVYELASERGMCYLKGPG
jgi:hypothetical protein